MAVSTFCASAVASNSITRHSIFTNPRTVAYRSTTMARHCPSGSAPSGGMNSCTPSTAARSRARDPTALSIASHTASRETFPPHPAASNSTSTAALRTPACRA